MKPFPSLFATLAIAALLSGCRNEPNPSEVAYTVQMNRIAASEQARVDAVSSRYAPGNVSQANAGAVVPVQVSQDGVAAHPRSVRNIMTPQGVKSYNIHRRIDAENPRVFHRYESVAVLEEDAFWRADGDDSAIIEGQMPANYVGNLAKQSDKLRQEAANSAGEQARRERELAAKTNELLAKTDDLMALIREKEKINKQLLESYEKLVQKQRADAEEMEKMREKITETQRVIDEAAKKMSSKSRRANTTIEGQ